MQPEQACTICWAFEWCYTSVSQAFAMVELGFETHLRLDLWTKCCFGTRLQGEQWQPNTLIPIGYHQAFEWTGSRSCTVQYNKVSQTSTFILFSFIYRFVFTFKLHKRNPTVQRQNNTHLGRHNNGSNRLAKQIGLLLFDDYLVNGDVRGLLGCIPRPIGNIGILADIVQPP